MLKNRPKLRLAIVDSENKDIKDFVDLVIQSKGILKSKQRYVGSLNREEAASLVASNSDIAWKSKSPMAVSKDTVHLEVSSLMERAHEQKPFVVSICSPSRKRAFGYLSHTGLDEFRDTNTRRASYVWPVQPRLGPIVEDPFESIARSQALKESRPDYRASPEP